MVIGHQRARLARYILVAAFAAVCAITVAIAAPGLGRLAGSEWPPRVGPPAGLPACRTAELPAPQAGYGEWADTLLDPANRLPADYQPPDLVTRQLTYGRVRVRSFVLPDLVAMLNAAAANGASVTINSSFRSYATQEIVFGDLAAAEGDANASDYAARPGHSEHQLGTAVDLGGGSDWLAANSWRYGFVMSYPAERSPAWTCYASEPWHYRYFGRDRAAAIHASGLSPREWLWQLHSGH